MTKNKNTDSRRIYASLTSARPSDLMTNQEWQQKFELLKHMTRGRDSVRKFGTEETGRWMEELHGTYYGATNWQQYCAFINDILARIRKGYLEYCYYSYQIADLLQCENAKLKTKYCPREQYWIVWLEKEGQTV